MFPEYREQCLVRKTDFLKISLFRRWKGPFQGRVELLEEFFPCFAHVVEAIRQCDELVRNVSEVDLPGGVV